MTSLMLTSERVPRGTVIRPCGEVDATNAAALAAALDEARHHGGALILDLRELGFLDSTGLKALLTAYNLAKDEGRGFHLADPHPHVHRLLQITGLLPVLRPHSSVEQALRAVAGEGLPAGA
ncbi:STAS domain-containing protein [Nonomuraea soli]|uniref:Anti-sigma factor antagonist n=1 Tax=Nonomuraea soli TaxID=1032476 RepID=A0A7W0CFE5_9ACTN|nr:STAS domain-containing protein [Nonomuraea soli]MBA2890187.1 anti-anti-sigma factor [Nonomuraea soli]